MNVTIDKFAHATIDPSPSGKVEFHAQDANSIQVMAVEDLDLSPGPQQLMRGVYMHVSDRLLGGCPSLHS